MARDNEGLGGALLFVTGAAIGAALGVLFAPRSGTDTREQLADWLKERREKGADLINTVKDESLAKKDAIVNAAKAAKQAFVDTNSKHHEHA
ncbi:MAG: YtxH domain-containing protein [Elusimicrobiota bacterium]|nr:YtxH domain-containing protein [Elusimicrobiota bacterium]